MRRAAKTLTDPIIPAAETAPPGGAASGDIHAVRRALRGQDEAGKPIALPHSRPGPLGLLLGVIPTLATLAAVIGGGFWLLTDPESPLPPAWNPEAAFDLSDPVTPLTGFKLRRALATEGACLAALETGAGFEPLDAYASSTGPQCGISSRVLLHSVGASAVAPVETSCQTALRLAVWERHVLPDAEALLGSPVAGISHQGSYNCRAIRGGGRMSSHATASAIDINGVTLADGREVALMGNWEGDGPEAQFWRAVRDGGCAWFGTVLGPDYDANHADHLHLQADGRGTCR